MRAHSTLVYFEYTRVHSLRNKVHRRRVERYLASTLTVSFLSRFAAASRFPSRNHPHPDEVAVRLAAELPAICRHAAHPVLATEPLAVPCSSRKPLRLQFTSFPPVRLSSVGLCSWPGICAAAGCFRRGRPGWLGWRPANNVRVKANSFSLPFINSTYFQTCSNSLPHGVALALGSVQAQLSSAISLTGPSMPLGAPPRSLRVTSHHHPGSVVKDPSALSRKDSGFRNPGLCTLSGGTPGSERVDCAPFGERSLVHRSMQPPRAAEPLPVRFST